MSKVPIKFWVKPLARLVFIPVVFVGILIYADYYSWSHIILEIILELVGWRKSDLGGLGEAVAWQMKTYITVFIGVGIVVFFDTVPLTDRVARRWLKGPYGLETQITNPGETDYNTIKELAEKYSKRTMNYAYYAFPVLFGYLSWLLILPNREIHQLEMLVIVLTTMVPFVFFAIGECKIAAKISIWQEADSDRSKKTEKKLKNLPPLK